MKKGYRHWIWMAVVTSAAWAQRPCPVDKRFLHLPERSKSATTYLRDSGDTLWVPLAIHVVESNPGEFPIERIGQQIAVLNRDYAPAKIQFYLPRYGPGGLPTCGVTRTVSALASHDWTSEEDTLKRMIHWPPDSFLNIWIVKWMPMQVIGYARALGDTESIPGTVLVSDVVGEGPGLRRPYDGGRTAVHEIGHVFSLLHPFESGCRGTTPATCAIEGDEICDTPPQREAHYGCPASSTNTCNELPTDNPDPINNFMGYVDDACMNQFTPEQIQRMRLFLLTQGVTLISEANKQARGFQLPSDTSCTAAAGLVSPAYRPSALWNGSVLRVPGAQALYLYDATGKLLLYQLSESVDASLFPRGVYVLVAVGRWGVLSYRLAIDNP
ncbi:MAG: zinc metalloprotease [Bacteroidia bacterium]